MTRKKGHVAFRMRSQFLPPAGEQVTSLDWHEPAYTYTPEKIWSDPAALCLLALPVHDGYPPIWNLPLIQRVIDTQARLGLLRGPDAGHPLGEPRGPAGECAS